MWDLVQSSKCFMFSIRSSSTLSASINVNWISSVTCRMWPICSQIFWGKDTCEPNIVIKAFFSHTIHICKRPSPFNFKTIDILTFSLFQWFPVYFCCRLPLFIAVICIYSSRRQVYVFKGKLDSHQFKLCLGNRRFIFCFPASTSRYPAI